MGKKLGDCFTEVREYVTENGRIEVCESGTSKKLTLDETFAPRYEIIGHGTKKIFHSLFSEGANAYSQTMAIDVPSFWGILSGQQVGLLDFIELGRRNKIVRFGRNKKVFVLILL